jgi:hypothetical protein
MIPAEEINRFGIDVISRGNINLTSNIILITGLSSILITKLPSSYTNVKHILLYYFDKKVV